METLLDKEQKLLDLATLRQETRYEGYNNIADYEDGFHECDYVSPYSKSAHNVNADVLVILQDWSSDESMPGKCEKTNSLGYSPSVNTNVKLIDLLKKHLHLKLEDTYATNLFPFIKMGGMSAGIPERIMRRAAEQFTLPMIDILKPKITIALGRKTYNAIYDACNSKQEILTGISFKYEGTKVFHQPHPAARISNIEKEIKWKEMAKYLGAAT